MQLRAELSDGLVSIRRPRAEDVPSVVEGVRESMREISAWQSWCHPNYSTSDAAVWLRSSDEGWSQGSECPFVIALAGTNVLAGSVGINFINRVYMMGNLGYWVRSSLTGRGIATAATRLAAQFGLRELGLSRIEIVAAVGNGASRRVAEKAGATMEGVLRNRLLIHNRPHDAVMYSLIAADFDL